MGSVDVGTMSGRSVELSLWSSEKISRRYLDCCCLQETRRPGDKMKRKQC